MKRDSMTHHEIAADARVQVSNPGRGVTRRGVIVASLATVLGAIILDEEAVAARRARRRRKSGQRGRGGTSSAQGGRGGASGSGGTSGGGAAGSAGQGGSSGSANGGSGGGGGGAGGTGGSSTGASGAPGTSKIPASALRGLPGSRAGSSGGIEISAGYRG
jgi:hypothetical protein